MIDPVPDRTIATRGAPAREFADDLTRAAASGPRSSVQEAASPDIPILVEARKEYAALN